MNSSPNLMEKLINNLTPNNFDETVSQIKNKHFNLNKSKILMNFIYKNLFEHQKETNVYALLCVKLQNITIHGEDRKTYNEMKNPHMKDMFKKFLITQLEITFKTIFCNLGTSKAYFENNNIENVRVYSKQFIKFLADLFNLEILNAGFIFECLEILFQKKNAFFGQCFCILLENTLDKLQNLGIPLTAFLKEKEIIISGSYPQNMMVPTLRNVLAVRKTNIIDNIPTPLPSFAKLIEFQEIGGTTDGNIEDKHKSSIRTVKQYEMKSIITNNYCNICAKYLKTSKEVEDHIFSKKHMHKFQNWMYEKNKLNDISDPEKWNYCAICLKKLSSLQLPSNHYKTEEHKKNAATYCYVCQRKLVDEKLGRHLLLNSHKCNLQALHQDLVNIKPNQGSPNQEPPEYIETKEISQTKKHNEVIEKAEKDLDELKQDIFASFEQANYLIARNNEESLCTDVLSQLKTLLDNIYFSKKVPQETALILLKRFNKNVEDIKNTVSAKDNGDKLMNQKEIVSKNSEPDKSIKDKLEERSEEIKDNVSDFQNKENIEQSESDIQVKENAKEELVTEEKMSILESDNIQIKELLVLTENPNSVDITQNIYKSKTDNATPQTTRSIEPIMPVLLEASNVNEKADRCQTWVETNIFNLREAKEKAFIELTESLRFTKVEGNVCERPNGVESEIITQLKMLIETVYQCDDLPLAVSLRCLQKFNQIIEPLID